MALALVTGGSRGFGRALTQVLATRGWSVIIDGRDAVALADVAEQSGNSVMPIPGSVVDPHHRDDLAREVRRRGSLDLLVNNASELGPSPLPELRDVSLEDMHDVFATNVFAPIALVQEVLDVFAEGRGAVVNVSSDAAVEPYRGWGLYGASKAALDQLTAVLAVEEPSLGVYSFDPGDMRTEMHQRAFPGEDISDRPLPETIAPVLVDLVERRPPSGRYRASDTFAEVTP